MKRPSTLECILGSLLLASLATAASAAERATDSRSCASEQVLSGEQYWFRRTYNGFDNVADSTASRTGRFRDDPAKCFRVPLAEIDMPEARLHGSKRGVLELLHTLTLTDEKWDAESMLKLRQQLKAITGLDFASLEALQAWWRDNNDYLVWSEADGHLAVDAVAKQNHRPSAPLTPRQEISAQRYWFFEGLGWVRSAADQGNYIDANVWAGDRAADVRVSKAALADLAAKQEGYVKAVALIIDDRFAIPELGAESQRKLVQRLRAITAERFTEKADWQKWWQANRTRLVLSPDGKRLVTK